MDSSTSSLLPPSAHSSHQSLPARSTNTLESLIPHLLASKRSLSSVSHVYRANELCDSTRLSLEKSAVITARTSFLRNGIISQTHVLQQVQQSATNTASQGKVEFEAAARDLDEADRRLRGTLEDLRETVVEAGLRPEAEQRRSLLDFVDEGGVEGLVGVIKSTIDGAGTSIQDFEETNRGFMDDVENVKRHLDGFDESENAVEGVSPLPDILHEMERYAKGMATDLEALVNHYDLCVTAVKHTEGGGAAATKFADNLPEGVDIGEDVAGPLEPINDEQRREMLRILEEDAGNVEGAVTDIRSHLVEMESLHERVQTHSDRLTRNHDSAIAAFKLLEAIGRKLPSNVTQSQVFLLRWDSEKAKIDERLEELEGLTQFYDGFLRAYDTLLIEIGRRKAMEQRMEKEVEGVRARLDKLYQDDAEEREAFRKEQGDFLPVDIWPGLMAEPLRFEVSPLDDVAGRVPDISKSVIHQAIRRIHGKG